MREVVETPECRSGECAAFTILHLDAMDRFIDVL